MFALFVTFRIVREYYMNIRKGDTVQIRIGKDRGKTGKVLAVYPKSGSVLVENINVYKKFQRPRRQGEKGEIVAVAKPLAAGKFLLFCRVCSRGRRIGVRRENTRRVRYCTKCRSEL